MCASNLRTLAVRLFWTVGTVLATAGGLWWVMDPAPERGYLRLYVVVVLVIYAIGALHEQWGDQ